MWNCVKPAQIAGIYFGYIQLTNTFACFWMIRLLISTYCIRYWHGEFHGILFFFMDFPLPWLIPKDYLSTNH